MIKNFKYVEKENKIKRKRFMIFRVKKTTHSNHMNVLYIDVIEISHEIPHDSVNNQDKHCPILQHVNLL